MIETLLPPLQRAFLFCGVLLLVGAVAWRGCVAPWQPPPLRPLMRKVECRLTRVAFWVTNILLCTWLVRLGVQVMEFRDPFAPLRDDVRFLLMETFWGSVWMAQGSLLVFLAGTFHFLARRARGKRERERRALEGGEVQEAEAGPGVTLPRTWKGAGTGILLLALTLSLSSHAMSVPLVAPLAVAMDTVHALAAGAWIGTLALIVGLRLPGREGSGALAGQLRAFSYLALASVPLLLLTGLMLSGFHVGELRNLWASGYGRVLSLKILTAAGVLLIGFRNWRYGLAQADEEPGARSVRRWAATEVGLAAGVVLLTAILVGMPMPEGVH